jgi:hypothetical protein
MGYATAGSNRISRLFHYQPFVVTHLAEVVADNILHFSDPRRFNDPWDCRPWFNAANLDDPVTLDHHIQWYKDITRRQRRDISEAQIEATAQRLRSDIPHFRSKIAQVSHSMANGIGDRYRVYCLSARSDCELMWAHYAASHSGICLEFSTHNAEFATALQVVYAERYPSFDITASGEEHSLLLLIAKSSSWQYEQEYRLVSLETANATLHGTLMSVEGKVGIPSNALTSIIVGCLASDDTVETVREIIRSSGKPINLIRCHRSLSSYELIRQAV